jgi:hypothetical protein
MYQNEPPFLVYGLLRSEYVHGGHLVGSVNEFLACHYESKLMKSSLCLPGQPALHNSINKDMRTRSSRPCGLLSKGIGSKALKQITPVDIFCQHLGLLLTAEA